MKKFRTEIYRTYLEFTEYVLTVLLFIPSLPLFASRTGFGFEPFNNANTRAIYMWTAMFLSIPYFIVMAILEAFEHFGLYRVPFRLGRSVNIINYLDDTTIELAVAKNGLERAINIAIDFKVEPGMALDGSITPSGIFILFSDFMANPTHYDPAQASFIAIGARELVALERCTDVGATAIGAKYLAVFHPNALEELEKPTSKFKERKRKNQSGIDLN